MQRVFIIVFIIFSFISLSGQITNREAKANKLYQNFWFEDAIRKYEKVKIDKLSTDGLRNMARAYRRIHQDIKAEESYLILVGRSDHKVEDLFEYGETLRMNDKVELSDEWMTKFHNQKKEDSRGTKYMENKDSYAEISEDQGRFRISEVDINSSYQDFGPAFYMDKIVFTSNRKDKTPIKRIWGQRDSPFLNIYEAEITQERKLINVKSFDLVNKPFHDGPATFSADGSLMVFCSNSYSKKKSKNKATRLTMLYSEKDGDGNWGEIIPFDFNNGEYSVGHPALTPDGKALYFVSDMPGGKGGTDLYVVERTESGWNKPQNLNELNTEGNEMFPFFQEDSLLFFASNGHFGLGGLDIFMAKRNKTAFGTVANVGAPINGPKDDFGFILDDIQQYGFFSSNRSGGMGSDDLYAFDLLVPYVARRSITIAVVDYNNKVLLQDGALAFSSNDPLGVNDEFLAKKGQFSVLTGEAVNQKLTLTAPGYVKQTIDLVIPEGVTQPEFEIIMSQFEEDGQLWQVMKLVSKEPSLNMADTVFVSKIKVEPEMVADNDSTLLSSNNSSNTGNSNENNSGSSNNQPFANKDVSKPIGKEIGSYQEFFDYNITRVNVNDPKFIELMDKAVAKTKEGWIIQVDIESSASKVPTTTYKTNDYLAILRGKETQGIVLRALEKRGIDNSKLVFNEIKPMVNGPEYRGDYKNRDKYKEFQYVVIRVK